MAGTDEQDKYLVAFFDILGFQQKFDDVGLGEIARRYDALIETIDSRNDHMGKLFGKMNFHESPYWTSEGDVVIFNRVSGAYASDSLLIWAHSTYPEAKGKSLDECEQLAKDPAGGWAYQSIPCDNFMDACNELICRSVEIDLPFRGALSMGIAILNAERRVFLGSPIIDAVRLEPGQRFIGASVCRPFVQQTIPTRFLLSFEAHLKDGFRDLYGGAVLDWPRHWRATRSSDIRSVIKNMAQNAGPALAYYEKTLDLISRSEQFAGQFESAEEVSIRSVYKAYSNAELAVRVRPVRSGPKD